MSNGNKDAKSKKATAARKDSAISGPSKPILSTQLSEIHEEEEGPDGSFIKATLSEPPEMHKTLSLIDELEQSKYMEGTWSVPHTKLRGHFHGQWDIDGAASKPHGQGTLSDTGDGFEYVGGWQGGMLHGKGKATWANGNIYEGLWRGNTPNGQGMKIYADGIKYVGQFENGKYHGHGMRSFPSGERYDGLWHTGARHGEGVRTFAPGDKSGRGQYKGEWNANKFHGRGRMSWNSWTDGVKKEGSKTYEGEWNDGKFQGRGKLSYANGEVYDGTWEDGCPCGIGIMTFAPGNQFCQVSYAGGWQDGKFNGKGVMTFVKGDKFGRAVYDGEWLAGKFHGIGSMTYSDGQVESGNWEEGRLQRRANSVESISPKAAPREIIQEEPAPEPRPQYRKQKSRLEDPKIAEQILLENEELRKQIEQLQLDACVMQVSEVRQEEQADARLRIEGEDLASSRWTPPAQSWTTWLMCNLACCVERRSATESIVTPRSPTPRSPRRSPRFVKTGLSPCVEDSEESPTAK